LTPVGGRVADDVISCREDDSLIVDEVEVVADARVHAEDILQLNLL
jgi:hypothetical protein